MRRVLFGLTVVGLLLATIAPAASAAGGGDRVSGWGVRAPSCGDGCPVGEFAFDARSGRKGQNPTGWFSIEFPGYASFVGEVTCLNMKKKWATIVGRITQGTGEGDPATFPPSGTDPVYFVLRVRGRGAPLPGRPGPDRMSFTAWDTEAGWLTDSSMTLADLCANPQHPNGVGPEMLRLVAGDIRVINRK